MTVQTVPGYLQNATGTNANVFRVSATAPFSQAGVLTAGELSVAAQTTPNMSVKVNAGRAKVAGTSVSPPSGYTFTTQGFYDVLNDGVITATIAASNPTQPRIDVVCLQVQDSSYAGSTDTAQITVVTGTAASIPAVPAIPANSLALANVAVAANATSIVSGNITQVAATAALLNQNIVRDYDRLINTGSVVNGATLSTVSLPALPVVSRAQIRFGGTLGFAPAAETIGVAISVSAGTLQSPPNYTLLVGNAQWSPYTRFAWVDIPANTACTITLSAEETQTSFYKLVQNVHVSLAGEFA